MNQISKPITLILFVLLSSLLLMGMSAQADDLPIRPLPLTPTPQQNPGGLLVLQASSTQLTQGMWTRIEWQDPNTGEWHEVDGWQGEFDGDNRVTWYVAPENFNETPFRWKVYSDQSQTELIATSESFELPNDRWQQTSVNIDW